MFADFQSNGRFAAVINQIDAENSKDPTSVIVEGESRPRELVTAERVTSCLEQFDATASDLLHIAARAHHLKRWEIPRNSYASGRKGYLSWRKQLLKHHANAVGDIMANAGYEDASIVRVQDLVRRRRLKHDADVQTLEDVICIVFMENEFREFSRQHERDKMLGIVRKTWRKMSPRGREWISTIKFDSGTQQLLKDALQDEESS